MRTLKNLFLMKEKKKRLTFAEANEPGFFHSTDETTLKIQKENMKLQQNLEQKQKENMKLQQNLEQKAKRNCESKKKIASPTKKKKFTMMKLNY